jgi:hypothetical protein
MRGMAREATDLMVFLSIVSKLVLFLREAATVLIGLIEVWLR